MLYLDTARLGQTSPSALETQIDFARLTAEQPSSLYTDRFLAGGIDDAPHDWIERFPGLRHWHGVADLKAAIRKAADAPSTHQVAIASRSTVLLRVSAQAMFRRCRNVFTTDLSWPAYHAEVSEAAVRSNQKLTNHPCRLAIEQRHLSKSRLIDNIVDSYEHQACDGIFLPAVDNFGIALPIREILCAIESIRSPRFVLIDGAQAMGHLPSIGFHDKCDVFLAGAHKWIRAGSPLGMAIYGHPRTREFLDRAFKPKSTDRQIDDPLNCFAAALEAGSNQRFTETVNVLPLLTCRAALVNLSKSWIKRNQAWASQLENRTEVERLALAMGWESKTAKAYVESGIVVLKRAKACDATICDNDIRSMFADNGIAVSTYRDGSVRLSMPKKSFENEEIIHLEYGLGIFNNRTFRKTGVTGRTI